MLEKQKHEIAQFDWLARPGVPTATRAIFFGYASNGLSLACT
jgi:hypothetical protein